MSEDFCSWDKEKLTTYYFYQQKLREILVFLGIIFLLVILPYGLGVMAQNIGFDISFCKFASGSEEVFEDCIKSSPLQMWGLGFIIILIFAAALVIVFMSTKIIDEWLKSNWERAEERADEYFKEEEKSSRRKK